MSLTRRNRNSSLPCTGLSTPPAITMVVMSWAAICECVTSWLCWVSVMSSSTVPSANSTRTCTGILLSSSPDGLAPFIASSPRGRLGPHLVQPMRGRALGYDRTLRGYGREYGKAPGGERQRPDFLDGLVDHLRLFRLQPYRTFLPRACAFARNVFTSSSSLF